MLHSRFENERATVVFGKITSAKTKIRILEKLLNKLVTS